MSFIKETGRFLMKTGLSPMFRIRQKDFVLRFYPSSISLVLWVDYHRRRTSYPTDENFFRSYLQPSDVVVDVGANIGFFSLMSAALAGETGRVYAIEAHPKTYEYLQGNIAANKFENISAYNLALGNRDGKVHFSDQSRDDRNAVVQDADGVEVTMARLDDIGITDNHIDLLKIDVEGYEKFVMEGAADILSRTRCVYFESHDVALSEFDCTAAELIRILTDQGFAIYRIQDDMVTPVSKDHQSPVCENLIAVRNLDEFLSRTKLSQA
ncbi:MAG: FkbM family methyltransferase [Sedimentisphaerales bacterium]|nr:FkbM family methyltransferase [Sedimentisphaerales bacterium]